LERAPCVPAALAINQRERGLACSEFAADSLRSVGRGGSKDGTGGREGGRVGGWVGGREGEGARIDSSQNPIDLSHFEMRRNVTHPPIAGRNER